MLQVHLPESLEHPFNSVGECSVSCADSVLTMGVLD